MPPAPPINAVSVCRLLVCISFIGRQNGTFVPELKEIIKAHSLSSDLMSTICLLYFQTNKSSPWVLRPSQTFPALGLWFPGSCISRYGKNLPFYRIVYQPQKVSLGGPVRYGERLWARCWVIWIRVGIETNGSLRTEPLWGFRVY